MPFLFLFLLFLSIFDLYLSFIGIQAWIGTLFACVAIGATIFCRTSIVLVIGSYMGAVNVLGWPWWGGVLVACPGLLFILPQMVKELFSRMR